MPSDKPKIVIRTEQETIDKLDIIAKEQNRSRANLAEYILKDFISQYEKENGRINNGKLSVTKIS
jgi:predicted transcriptional regulator